MLGWPAPILFTIENRLRNTLNLYIIWNIHHVNKKLRRNIAMGETLPYSNHSALFYYASTNNPLDFLKCLENSFIWFSLFCKFIITSSSFRTHHSIGFIEKKLHLNYFTSRIERERREGRRINQPNYKPQRSKPKKSQPERRTIHTHIRQRPSSLHAMLHAQNPS